MGGQTNPCLCIPLQHGVTAIGVLGILSGGLAFASPSPGSVVAGVLGILVGGATVLSARNRSHRLAKGVFVVSVVLLVFSLLTLALRGADKADTGKVDFAVGVVSVLLQTFFVVVLHFWVKELGAERGPAAVGTASNADVEA